MYLVSGKLAPSLRKGYKSVGILLMGYTFVESWIFRTWVNPAVPSGLHTCYRIHKSEGYNSLEVKTLILIDSA